MNNANCNFPQLTVKSQQHNGKQTKMVDAHDESAFSQVLILQQWSLYTTVSRHRGFSGTIIDMTAFGDKSTQLDACQTAQESRKPTRVQQVNHSIFKMQTNYFGVGQFTSHDGETIESYYTRFYKMMNEMIRNNLTVATMQVNVQFLQQLQLECLKQDQRKLMELRAERKAMNANPLALQRDSQTNHQNLHLSHSYEEEMAPEQAQKDKDMQKNLALIAKYFKKLYKPTNNNLRTSSNTRNRNVDTTQVQEMTIKWTVWESEASRMLLGLGKTVGGQTPVNHKEKMLLCKQAEKGVQLQAEQSDWLADTDEEIDEQELEAHYSYMAKIQEVPNADSGTDTEPLEQIVQLILFIVDSGCTKHMTGNVSLLCNFVEKYLGTVRFGNDQFAPILGYGDLVQGNITIKRVYYVEGLNHNLFSVGQFCDADLEVAFRKSTCFVRDLQGNDLLSGNRGSDLYTISLQETTSSTPICLLAKASPTQAWLWHRRLSHLNFDYTSTLSKKIL
ncbi:integrase, catalytic region, zinc finger, CCHC-type containing protein [Tanacetum coccineum]|uniref:Integrase, catalytic region, zinc finger, CCHC-type containing protein n=1 Tax=Tanacetum coccineum TaxID=301880 RepID=A0ABQ5DTC8_9ASTR